MERLGHPRVLVRPVPDRHSNTALCVHTRPDQACKVSFLLLQTRLAAGRLHPDVRLRVRDLYAKRGVGSEGASKILSVRRLAHGEVRLQAHTVDPDSVGLDHLHQPLRGGRLGSGILDAVVVVVQLRGRVSGGGGGGKGYGDIGLADGLVEDVLTVGAVVVES